MPSLRALAEADLATTLEGAEWGADVHLTTPDGVALPVARGQVLYNIARVDPVSGEKLTIDTLVVTLRRSSLARVPMAGENWLITVPVSPVAGAATKQFVFSPTRPPEGGAAIGFIRLYLQEVEQS